MSLRKVIQLPDSSGTCPSFCWTSETVPEEFKLCWTREKAWLQPSHTHWKEKRWLLVPPPPQTVFFLCVSYHDLKSWELRLNHADHGLESGLLDHHYRKNCGCKGKTQRQLHLPLLPSPSHKKECFSLWTKDQRVSHREAAYSFGCLMDEHEQEITVYPCCQK